MVAGIENEVVLRFVARLNRAMDALELPARGRPAWLAKQLKISVTAAQKYLNGSAMPKGTRYAELAALLRVSVGWLRDGHGPMKDTAPEGSSVLLERMHAAWRALPDDAVRLEVLHYIEHRASLGELQLPPRKDPKTQAGR